jgi:hypothetical protein
MSYREELPPSCPPPEAEEILAARNVFRVVVANPPTEEDFQSQRAGNPDGKFSVSECIARGVSVFAEKRDCTRILKLPRMKGRAISRVRLEAGAGRILQTFQPSHHTWWPLAEFPILEHCSPETL